MNNLQFVSSLVGHIAWPLLVGCVVIGFRSPIVHLIDRIKSYEGFGQKVEFGDKLALAERTVDHLAEEIATESEGKRLPVGLGDTATGQDSLTVDRRMAVHDVKQNDNTMSELLADAERHPSSVLLSSWASLQRAVGILIGESKGDDIPDELRRIYLPTPRGLRELQEKNLVNENYVSALNQLSELRNSVAHGKHNPTSGEAIAYAETAAELAGVSYALADFLAGQRDRRGRAGTSDDELPFPRP